MSVSNQELANKRKGQFARLIAENTTYPLATITYHGPSPDKATKIVVGVLISQKQAPLIKFWSGEGIADDEESAQEIAEFIKDHQVARVLTSEWVLSCPHEEGMDYPAGEICPYCPDWR
jgi:hypothetical protein